MSFPLVSLRGGYGVEETEEPDVNFVHHSTTNTFETFDISPRDLQALVGTLGESRRGIYPSHVQNLRVT